MAFFHQGVGAGEQKQRRVPEPDKVGHEGLLVGEDEAAEHDQQFGRDHQQREPGKTERARPEDRDDDPDGDQGEMDPSAAKTRPRQIEGHLLTEETGQESFDPEK